MRVARLWLSAFRSYEALDLALPPGLTAIVGENGQGKTNVLEAVAWLASMRSFRGAGNDALVRTGHERAIVRAEVVAGERPTLLEAEVAATGRSRVLVNRQRLPRARDLLGHLRVTVFSPDDLALVKGPPAGRRDWLDDLLVASNPRNDRLRGDFERILRQRNALLKQAAGRLSADVASTLDVWDAKLAATGDALGAARAAALEELAVEVSSAYRRIARGAPDRSTVGMRLEAPWRARGLADELERSRQDDVRRATTTVGPHRDDVVLDIDGLASRTQRSQGEQRSLALALQLAAHRWVAAVTATTPVLLLDDVFSELDEHRCRALLDELPAVQTLLTSAVGVPAGIRPELVVDVRDGWAAPQASTP